MFEKIKENIQKKQVVKEKKQRDDKVNPLARDIIKVIGTYHGSLDYDADIQEEIDPYVRNIMELLPEKELTVREIKVAVRKALDIANSIIVGANHALDMLAGDIEKKIIGKEMSSLTAYEIDRILKGEIKYTTEYDLVKDDLVEEIKEANDEFKESYQDNDKDSTVEEKTNE